MGFATQRLLGNQRIGTHGASMNLVGHQVAQLHHIDVTDDDFLIERLTRPAINQPGLAILRQLGFFEVSSNVFLFNAIEHGSGELEAQQPGRPTQVRLQDLADVHARGHPQRV